MTEKLKATPGGAIAPEHVFGRDELIEELWEMLESSSVRLTAERRVGKTSIIRKMSASPVEGKLVYWWDVSSAQTAGEFAQSVYERVEGEISKRKVVMTRARQFLSELGGGEISIIKLPAIANQNWKSILEKTIADLVEHCGRDVVFLWDEMPWLLEKIAKNAETPAQGERLAMELLDTLRALRQMHPSLRMVFSGSIGLHHVLNTLRDKGYNNNPVNDMPLFEVPPHSLDAARELALELLRNELIPVEDERAVADALATGVGGFSFYIHRLVVALRAYRKRGGPVTVAIVEKLITDALEDDRNSWELRHYIERLPNYYGDRAPLARDILDEVALAPSPLSFAQLLNALHAQNPNIEKEAIRELIELLRRDHYLTIEGEGYSFRYGLVGRYWRINRGLGA